MAIKHHWLKITMAIILVWIIALIWVWQAEAASPVALIDPDPIHAATMLRAMGHGPVTVYGGSVLGGMRQVYLDRVPVVVIPYYFGGCNDPRQGAVSNALRDLATTSSVFIAAINCPALSQWSTFVGLADSTGRVIEPNEAAEVWSNGCFENWCSYSTATVRAGIGE